MKKILALVLALVMLLLMGCGETPAANDEAEPPTAPPTEEEVPETEKTWDILFVGNSYTYGNNMPDVLFKKIAKSAGYEVKVTAITEGGHTLEEFANPEDTFGKMVDIALGGSKKYDYVILQEQSLRPAGEEVPAFYEAVRNLAERIRSTGAEPVLYATWGRKTGSSDLSANGWTNESMTWRLAAAYQAIGNELEIPVAYAGLAFYDVYTNAPGVEIYDSDMTHASYEGSYLVAATLFAKIFGVDPTTVTYMVRLTEEEKIILQEAARKAVFETPEIPAEYVVSSVGVRP